MLYVHVCTYNWQYQYYLTTHQLTSVLPPHACSPTCMQRTDAVLLTPMYIYFRLRLLYNIFRELSIGMSHLYFEPDTHQQ